LSEDRGHRRAPDEAAPLRARAAELERLARFEAERALRESEARYRELVDQCPDPIVVHRDGIILFANEATARMAKSDLAPADLVGRHVLDFVHPKSSLSRALSSPRSPPEPRRSPPWRTACWHPTDASSAWNPWRG
jgi:PAS domain-containing protein